MSYRPPIGKVLFHVSFLRGILPCRPLNQAKIPHHIRVVCPIAISLNTWLRRQSDKFLCLMLDPPAILQYTHLRLRGSICRIHGQRFSASSLRKWSHHAIVGLLDHFARYPSIGLRRRTFFKIPQGRGIQRLPLPKNRGHRQRLQTVCAFLWLLHWSNPASFLA